MCDSPRILIVGVGNELLTDDGVGIHAIRQLQQESLAHVTLLELGTAVLHGLDFLERADRVLVIDAARGGRPPGTIYLFDSVRNSKPQVVTSIHAMGLREAGELLLQGHSLPPITVLGVEPHSLDYGMNLSCTVQAVLPRVVWLARQTVMEWLPSVHATPMPVLAEA